MFVLRCPRALHSGDRFVQMIHHGCRRIALLDGRRVHERLERRAGLTVCLNGAVEMARIEIASANHGSNETRIGLERDEGTLEESVWRRRGRLDGGCFLLTRPAR